MDTKEESRLSPSVEYPTSVYFEALGLYFFTNFLYH
jgi:hypothetical protein